MSAERRPSDDQLDEVFLLVTELGSRVADLEEWIPEVLWDSRDELHAAVRLLNRAVGRTERLLEPAPVNGFR